MLIAVDRRTKLIARCIDRLIDAPFFRNIAVFIIPYLCLAPPQGSEFREYLDTHKTRMNGLSCGKESMEICSAVLIQCQRVTDGQTDVQPISITCFSIADARKNGDISEKRRVDQSIDTTCYQLSATVDCDQHTSDRGPCIYR